MKRIVVTLSAIIFVAAIAAAQEQTPQPGAPPARPMPGMEGMPAQNTPRAPYPPPPDPLGDVMFPPDMIMGHARQLNLTDEQKTFMRGEILKTTTSFQDLQWKLQDQMEELHEIMKAGSVNEEQALGQLSKVLDTEGQIKRLHFGLAVRLKNHLTAEQQDQLEKMRMDQPRHMPGPPAPAEPGAPAAPRRRPVERSEP
jgi:Spy/CpxP family protein refolding chaperone